MKKEKNVTEITEKVTQDHLDKGIFGSITGAKENLDNLKKELEICDCPDAAIFSILKNPYNRKISVTVAGSGGELVAMLVSVMRRDEEVREIIEMAALMS